MKRFGMILGFALVVALAAQAAPLTASYVDGKVEVKNGATWKALEEGDKLDSAAVVRIGTSSFLELSGAASRITLSAAGTYNLATLSADTGKDKKVSSVVGKLGKMVKTDGPQRSTVAGVRGDFEGKAEKTAWAEDSEGPSASDIAVEARKLADAQKYSEAAKKFAEAVKVADPATRPEYQYSEAWAHAAAGEVVPAIKILRPMSNKGAWAVSRGILLARLDLNTGASDEASRLLDELSKNTALSADEAQLVKDMKAELTAPAAK